MDRLWIGTGGRSVRRRAEEGAMGRLFVRLAVVLALAVTQACGLAGGLAPFAGAALAQDRTRIATLVTAGGRHDFVVEVARDEASRAQGLMFRTELAANAGMLFDFQQERELGFWMRNTYVSLDMIFIRADGRVHRIAENTTPLSEATVPSGGPCRFVLEVVAGTARRIGLRPGDRLEHALVKAGAGAL